MSRSVVIPLILLLAGCGGGARGVAGPPTFGDPAELVAWVKVTPVAFHAREAVQIEVGVRNPTTHPIIVAFPSACISYVVKNANGIPVAPGVLCTGIGPPHEIAPGAALTAQFSWDGTTGSGMALAPGDYQVGSSGVHPSATPVTIRILAP